MVSNDTLPEFLKVARTINECFHAYGIHSATLQPETPAYISIEGDHESKETQSFHKRPLEKCQVVCSPVCEELTCCSH